MSAIPHDEAAADPDREEGVGAMCTATLIGVYCTVLEAFCPLRCVTTSFCLLGWAQAIAERDKVGLARFCRDPMTGRISFDYSRVQGDPKDAEVMKEDATKLGTSLPPLRADAEGTFLLTWGRRRCALMCINICKLTFTSPIRPNHTLRSHKRTTGLFA